MSIKAKLPKLDGRTNNNKYRVAVQIILKIEIISRSRQHFLFRYFVKLG